MKIQGIKRITVEEFKPEEQEMAGKIGFILNNFMEQVTYILSKNVDYDNLNREVINFNTVVDANGVPKNPLQLQITLKTRLRGFNILKADNIQDGTPLTGAPFMVFTMVGTLVTITRVVGLPANKKFSFTVEAIG